MSDFAVLEWPFVGRDDELAALLGALDGLETEGLAGALAEVGQHARDARRTQSRRFSAAAVR